MQSRAGLLAGAGMVLMAATGVSAQTAAIPRPVSIDVVWPAAGEVERLDGNGLSIAGGVATVDGSDQYGLRALAIDADRQSVNFVYVDAWALDSARPPSCSFTFRRVERLLTQGEANALSDELATAEMTRLKADHPDIAETGRRSTEGSTVVRRVDRFTFKVDEATASGLSKAWVFVLDAKAYYVNKVCVAPDPAALTVIDQLIGLNYRSGVTPPPGDAAPPPAPAAWPTSTAPRAVSPSAVSPSAVSPSVVSPSGASPPDAVAPARSGWRMPRLRLPRLR